MLIERGAVEMRKAMRIGREMRRHPVEDDADADLVRAVDEPGKAFRIAEPRGRRIKPGRLVAPGRIVGVFGDRQELDVGEAHVDDIGDQPLGQLVQGQERAVRLLLPRAGMDLVDRHRLAAGVDAAPVLGMRLVVPFVMQRTGDDRCRLRAQFGAEGERIGLQRQHHAIRPR